ncbi:hypothetical protein GCM10023350_23890 [Nocardioides endophyticus]|uniref:Uncharacterized protein n=1 Tax=Nocardioides endophyticus TaxID=1353775 RepID=A0ABP8YW59_9ACTN
MSPLSWPVMIGTLAVGSPALYAAQVSGTLSPDVALVRLLICMAGVWLVCAVVASMIKGTVAANKLAAVAEAAGDSESELDPDEYARGLSIGELSDGFEEIGETEAA